MHFVKAVHLALLAACALSYAAAQGPGAFGDDCATLCNPPTCEVAAELTDSGSTVCIRDTDDAIPDCVCPPDTVVVRESSPCTGGNFRKLAGHTAVEPPARKLLSSNAGLVAQCNCDNLPVCSLGGPSEGTSGDTECFLTSDLNGDTCFCPENTFISVPATQVSF